MKRQQLSRLLAMGLLCVIFSLSAYAEKKPEALEATDFIGLAATLIKDGHFDRALLALQSVDTSAEDTDLARFYTLQGLAYLNLNELPGAIDSLQQAITNGQQEPVIYVYLAQAHFRLKNFQETINAVNKAGIAADEYPSLTEMKAQSHWQLKQYQAAIATVNEGQVKYPDDFRFLRRKVFYFVELELYVEAATLGREYLSRSKAKTTDYIAIGNALRLSREYDQALSILEIARLQFPANSTVAKVLAHTYLDQDKINAAAFILEQAGRTDPAMISEAAELYRRAGRLYKALALNAGITDQQVKYKQRMAILLALKRYERAANMKPALFRAGLLDDENIRYALAYAYFAIGQYAQANQQIEFLKEPDLFKKGVELRRVMAECKEERWQCA